jgi:hypothetical protein
MRMQYRSHDLPSFCQYINKAFSFRSFLPSLSDSRHQPEISPQSVFLALFHSFLFRLPSIQQLETDLRQSAFQRIVDAPRPFRDDTLRYSLCGFHLDPLEQMLVDINRRLKRSKALDQDRPQGHVVAALDGIEVLASYSRCCDSCLQRKVFLREGGSKVEQTQYYHRAVGCQIVNSPVKPFLAVEWLQPGEGEDTAALRLLRRLPDLYGSRFFDILLMDALYAQAPVLSLAQHSGWDVVISLKQNARELYQSAMGLFLHRDPDACFSERVDEKTYRVRLWDSEGLPFSPNYLQPMRVVRCEEELERNRYRLDKVEAHTTEHEWTWITTLPTQAFPGRLIRQLGHGRWKLENNGWMDLTQHWAFKHDFVHACRHRPRETGPDGQRQLVANRALAAATLILLIAFVLSAAFVLRHSKLVRLHGYSAVAVARQLYLSLSKRPPSIRAPSTGSPASS